MEAGFQGSPGVKGGFKLYLFVSRHFTGQNTGK